MFILIIVDTTAAPVLYIVGQKYSCSLCEIYRITMNRDFFYIDCMTVYFN